jgi:hypothetical protein
MLSVALVASAALPSTVAATHCDVTANRPTLSSGRIGGLGGYFCAEPGGIGKRITVRLQRYNSGLGAWLTVVSSTSPWSTQNVREWGVATTCASGQWRTQAVFDHSWAGHDETVNSSSLTTSC